jgi:glycosyltransferase involved in cell wall biosynthesis
VAVSDQEAAEGRAVLGSAAAHLHTITNGVNRNRFSPDGPIAEREADVPLIVCVGRLSRQKGQDLAIRALAALENPGARLRLVGGEHPVGEKQALEELAAELGVADRVEWRGRVADTAPELRAADVVISPSRWEGLSLVFLEAMACGATLVVADVFGSDAVGPAGVIIPVDDVAALKTAVDELLADPDRRSRLGNAARERSASYDVATTLSRNLELWAQVVSDRTGSRL